jgi:hypothetical protein
LFIPEKKYIVVNIITPTSKIIFFILKFSILYI